MTAPAIDLAPVVSAFSALVSSVPTRNATVASAEQAVTDALENVERQCALLVWERARQERRAREKAEATQAQADERAAKIAARKALHAKARGAK